MKTIFKIVFFMLLSFQFCQMFSQNRKADSIANLLVQHTQNDTLRANLLNSLGFSLYLTNTDTVKIIAQEALSLSVKLEYKKGQARSFRLMGLYYDMKTNYPMALEFYQKSLKLSEERGDKKGISDCLNSMGVIYSDQGNEKQALEYYEKALSIFRELNDQQGISFCLNNIGVIYYDQNKQHKALDYFKKSMELDVERGSLEGIAIGFNNLGEVYRDLGKYDTSLDYLQRSLKIAVEINDIYGQSYLFKDFASVYYLLKEYQKALDYAKNSLAYATYNDYFDIEVDVYLQLSKIYAALNLYKEAYENHLKYRKLSDSIYSEKDLAKTIGLEYHYKYEKEKQETNLLQDEELKRQKLIRNSFIVGFLLMIVLTIMIIRGFMQKSRHNKLLSLKNQNIEKKSKQLHEQNEEIQQLYEELSAANEVLFAQKEELEKHRNNLEALVKERTIELERSKDKAEESDRLKSAFLTNMSHEIRTPLNAIIGFADLLADPDVEQGAKDELQGHMNHSTDTLLKLIDDIFDIAKIESGQLSITRSKFSVNELVKNLVPVYEDKRKKLQRENVQLKINAADQDVVLNADPIRLQQILINLIDNAFKFTEEGSVTVGFGYSDDGERVDFFVKDTGIGMNKVQINYVFERFVKVEEDTTKIYRGAGLGLAICKNIIELLGGDLSLESEVGKGSTFYFSIPIEE